MFIDKLDHKPTIHRISTNTPQKELHQIDLQEDRGELCIENQTGRRSHLANNYGPEVCGKLLTTHRRGYGVDVEALRDRIPLRQVAGKGPKMGSHGYRRLRRWKRCFVALPRGVRV